MSSRFFKITGICFLLLWSIQVSAQDVPLSSPQKMKIRIAEIEINPEYLEEYTEILLEESRASIELEPGVISIFPFSRPENPTFIQLLEIYASEDAYKSHIASEHFQKYKTSTLHMVKSLQLIEMDAIDPQMMPEIFKKIQNP